MKRKRIYLMAICLCYLAIFILPVNLAASTQLGSDTGERSSSPTLGMATRISNQVEKEGMKAEAGQVAKQIGEKRKQEAKPTEVEISEQAKQDANLDTKQDATLEEETYTLSDLEKAQQELASISFNETKTTERKMESMEANFVQVDKELEEEDSNSLERPLREGDRKGLSVIRSGDTLNIIAVICIASGILLGFYTTYMVYQLKKDKKKARNL